MAGHPDSISQNWAASTKSGRKSVSLGTDPVVSGANGRERLSHRGRERRRAGFHLGGSSRKNRPLIYWPGRESTQTFSTLSPTVGLFSSALDRYYRRRNFGGLQILWRADNQFRVRKSSWGIAFSCVCLLASCDGVFLFCPLHRTAISAANVVWVCAPSHVINTQLYGTWAEWDEVSTGKWEPFSSRSALVPVTATRNGRKRWILFLKEW